MELSKNKKDWKYLNYARKIALRSTCHRARCGSIIVKKDKIIGKGFNSPPKNLESQRKCDISKKSFDEKITDKTCCIHAEQRAIIDALKKFPDKIEGSILYFMRINKKGEKTKAGKPYCTICSKMALDVGISKWVLLHENGICIYDSEEYNKLSFNYHS